MNSSFRLGENSSAILDFGANPPEVSRLTIKTPAENFQSNVTIYGSDSPDGWRVIKSGAYIYSYTDRRADFRSQNTTIDFPLSIFRYLRLEIEDTANNPVEISSVTVDKQIRQEAKERMIAPVWKSEEDRTEKITVLYLDLGAAGIPTYKIKLAVPETNFNRSVSVWGSYDNGRWRQVGQSYIFRYNTAKFKGENLELVYQEATER